MRCAVFVPRMKRKWTISMDIGDLGFEPDPAMSLIRRPNPFPRAALQNRRSQVRILSPLPCVSTAWPTSLLLDASDCAAFVPCRLAMTCLLKRPRRSSVGACDLTAMRRSVPMWHIVTSTCCKRYKGRFVALRAPATTQIDF